MLSYSTEFPIGIEHDANSFLALLKEWILNSPHSNFHDDDFSTMPTAGNWTSERGGEKLQLVGIYSEGTHSIAIRRLQFGDINWETTLVWSKSTSDTWVSIRIAREAIHPAARLPLAKRPLLVGSVLNTLGGAQDGALKVSLHPHFLSNSEIEKAARLIQGTAGCHLPTVYVSCGFSGSYPLDINALANDLAGMAHVVVEPNRPFSRRLMIEVRSENVYGGAIGIYWPNGQGRRSLFALRDYETSAELKRSVTDEVRGALLNRRPMPRCSWSGVQEAYSRAEYARLKASGSHEVTKYTEAFDAELNAVKERLREGEEEIARLRAEVRRYESDKTARSGLYLNIGSECDLYPGEIFQILTEALVRSADNAQTDSRREHVLRSLAAANPTNKAASELRDRLKELLRSYRSMDPKCEKELEDLGFSVSAEGKHYKLVFQDDERYTFVLPKSGSDVRGGLNAASDIAKRLF